jgi:multidrug resistance efflux pump
VYASGIVKSKNQYEVFANVSGIIEHVFVSEGDTVKEGMPLISIFNETQRLNKENASLAAQLANFNANQGKLSESKTLMEVSKSKMLNDSIMYVRQLNLWNNNIGSKVQLEQAELAYQNSKANFKSSTVRYEDLKRQLDFNSNQANKTLQIYKVLEKDFIIKSKIDGVVYQLFKSKGETPIAIVGDSKYFVLEMQVDEYDIMKIKEGLPVLVTMDSYRGKVFDAAITKIYPIMNERSKTFTVEATFLQSPEILYPNVTFEANIVLSNKENALLIPRNFVFNDSLVLKSNKEKVVVKTGLKDYKNVEIISGLTQDDEIIMPTE